MTCYTLTNLRYYIVNNIYSFLTWLLHSGFMLKIVKNYVVRGQLISVFNLEYIFYLILEILKIVFPSFCNLMASSMKVESQIYQHDVKKSMVKNDVKVKTKAKYSDYSNEIFMKRSSIFSECYQVGWLNNIANVYLQGEFYFILNRNIYRIYY